MCAIDIAAESADLIRYAADLADFFKAKLRLVHAITAIQGSPEMYLNTEFREFVFQTNRAEIRKL